jgi:hypothetical protein
MYLLLLVSSIFFDQSRIDEAMSQIRTSYNEEISGGQCTLLDDITPGGPMRLEKYSREKREDIVIGDTPAETLSVTGYYYNQGNIVIVGDGVLEVKNANFNLDGDILITGRGRAIFDSSDVNIVQHYIYQHVLFIVDSAYCSITNSETSFSGYQLSVSIALDGEINMRNVTNQDWITAAVQHTAGAVLRDVDGYTGEWLFAGDCSAEFKHVDYLLTWYFFSDGSVVDFDFPEEDTIYAFSLDSTLANVSGVGYHIDIDSCTDCMWATIPLRGSDVTIRDSDLRVTGLMFEGRDTFSVSGLVNGLDYSDWLLPVSDRSYRLINTGVQTWNLYPDDTTNITLSNSIFGELCGFTDSYTTIQNAFCDGTGGHIEAAQRSLVAVYSSSIFADVLSKDRGICLLANCAMPYGRIWATGASIMVIVNSTFPEEPIPSDTSIVFVASLTAPSSGSIEDSIGIIGSAWIDKGPFQPLDFDHYFLSFRKTEDSILTPFGDEMRQEVRGDTLGYWNTSGLTEGTYEIKLVLKDNEGDSVEAWKQINLKETSGIEERNMPITDISIKQVGARLFQIETSPDIAKIDIYNITGCLIKSITTNKTCWHAPSSGIYFLKNDKKSSRKKIIVY